MIDRKFEIYIDFMTTRLAQRSRWKDEACIKKFKIDLRENG